MEIETFAEIEEEFHARVSKIVWCTFTTINSQDRPRSRILHPLWEGSTGWIATSKLGLKGKHIAHNPFVSLTYWTPEHQQVYVECKAEWIDELDEKKRLWDVFKNTSPPLGYDLAMFFQTVENPALSMMKLTPWRIELFSLGDLMSQTEPKIWRQDV